MTVPRSPTWPYIRVVSPDPAAAQSTAVTSTSTAELTAAELVKSVQPPDDAGAATADRYDWQAAMAAADGLALFLNGLGDDGRLRSDCEDWVLCEWHEDWVVFSGGNVILVSCKHRDPSAGAYTTVAKLADEGGLAHLFNRWTELREKCSCRLVTSGGLSGLSRSDPQKLLAAARHFRSLRLAEKPVVVNSEHAEIVAKFRKTIATYCDDTKRRWLGDGSSAPVEEDARDSEVARFLAVLTIDEGAIQRDHVDYAAPAKYVQPILNRQGLTGSVEEVWEAVVSLFRLRMRARGPLPSGGLPAIVQPDENPSETEKQRALATRSVTMREIETAMNTALTIPGGYKPVPPMLRTTRLEVKMCVGGCSDNAIERALSLRSEYQTYWRDRESIEPAARTERNRLERLLHRISDHSTDPAQRRGAVLWRVLEAALDTLEQERLPAGMDADLALGGVCDLAAHCKVWFGPKFDVDSAIARLREAHEAET